MDVQGFCERLIGLCLGSGVTGLPRNPESRLLFLKSVVLTLDRDARYAESELDKQLQSWLLHIGSSIRLDHVNLRRWLVDEGFLERTRDGSAYWIGANPTGAHLFDASVEECDPYQTILSGKSIRERRKVEFLERLPANGLST